MDEQCDRKKSQNERLESVGWGLFLIMIGCLWLAPNGTLPKSVWLLGAGAIMIALNLVRLAVGIEVSVFTLVVGTLAVALGLGDIYNVEVQVIPIVAILAGVAIIFKALMTRKKITEPTDSDDLE